MFTITANNYVAVIIGMPIVYCDEHGSYIRHVKNPATSVRSPGCAASLVSRWELRLRMVSGL
jgi:hypothetical protein